MRKLGEISSFNLIWNLRNIEGSDRCFQIHEKLKGSDDPLNILFMCELNREKRSYGGSSSCGVNIE